MTNQSQQHPPLWVVMDEAGDPLINKHTLGPQTWRQIRASELRAIASEAIKAARAADVDQEARNWFYNWLQNEAKHAEAGE